MDGQPNPSRRFEDGLKNIAEYGFTIVPEVLTGTVLQKTRKALYLAAEQDRQRQREIKDFALDFGEQDANQRIWNVLSRDPLFEDMATHPLAMEYVRKMIGWPALLGNLSANICYPGCSGGYLHADQTFLPLPWPEEGPQGLNCAWALDDFTADNGATCVVAGSHRWGRPVGAADLLAPAIPLEAPAGSMIVFESRLWHKTGANISADSIRAGVFAWYTKTYVRPQENWFLSLKPEVQQFGSPTMLTLLGYQSQGFGMVNGKSAR